MMHETPGKAEETEWQEYRLVVGYVSDKAKKAIESVNGEVIPMSYCDRMMYSVRLLHHPDDNDQGFCWFADGKLFIHSVDNSSTLCLESDVTTTSTTKLRLVTDEEWFAFFDTK
jgi:hypothetical protein